MNQISVIIGAQWGDEGKGKWVDKLAQEAQYVVRFQGGNNAGHTIYVEGTKFVLHQIPSGILHAEQKCALGAGVVLNPVALYDEIEKLSATVKISPERLLLSAKAHVITPWHIWLDCQFEQSSSAIGTTKRGIGPTYADKATRSGLRMTQYIDEPVRLQWINTMKAHYPDFARCYLEAKEAWQRFDDVAKALKPYVQDVESILRKALKEKKTLLIEGAQGSLLDLNYGTYPFVTSSSTIAGGAAASLGLPPKSFNKVIGVAKAYLTRVGEGPMPTELHDEIGKTLAQKGNEFGATTGRPRRVGWFDAVAMRYAQDINGFDEVILNKMDILCGFKELKIAISYSHPELGEITEFPDNAEVLAKCKPNYVTLPGFDSLPKTGRKKDLSAPVLNFIAALESYGTIKIGMIGTGGNRDDCIFLT